MPANAYTQETVPKKPLNCRAILVNQKNEILIVKSPHKAYWTIPGGVIEPGESPREACLREIHEETGLTINRVSLICIDYKKKATEDGDILVMVFNGGLVSPAMQTEIIVDGQEISEARFINSEEAKSYFSSGMASRIAACMEAITTGQVVYLENGVKK
jgi:8-oxo-dGTP diphosphatase